MARATKRDMLERKEAIYDALDSGEKTSIMITRLAVEWECSETSIRRQYRDILDELKEKSDERREDLGIALLERARKYEMIAAEAGAVKLALDAVNLQAKLAGIYNPPKEQAETKKTPPTFQFEQVDNSQPLVLVDDDDSDKVSGE